MTPRNSPWLILENAPASFTLLMVLSPVTKLMNAWTRDPVASVAMNESIRMTTTTKPLITPMISATTIPASVASQMFQLSVTMKCAAVTPDSDITYANDKSNVRVDNGTMSASAASAVMALSSSTCWTVARWGKVCGAQMENTMQIAMST